VVANCRQSQAPAAPSNPVTGALSSVAQLDESLNGSGSVCKRCGGRKCLGAAAGNRIVVVWSTEMVVKAIHMHVHVTRMLVNNLSACIAENPSCMGSAIWCARKWPI